MSPQEGPTPLAATVLGTMGTVCWCIQLVPQIVHNFRRKSTEGLPATGVPFGVYAVLQKLNIPLQIQPGIFTALSLVTFGQCLYYTSYPEQSPVLSTETVTRSEIQIEPDPETSPRRFWILIHRIRHHWLLAPLLAVLFALIEALLILLLRPLPPSRLSSATTVIGIVAAILLAAGLLPPYFELAKRRGRVVGISWVFLGTDWVGAALSLGSLAAEREWDVLGVVMYCVVLALETGLGVSQGVWWWRIGRGVSGCEGCEVDEERKGDVEKGRNTVNKGSI